MARVRLLHWNATEAAATRDLLIRSGFQVEYNQTFDSTILRSCRDNPPAAFVISLSRLPSHGREVAIALRQSPKTRQIPIIFCDGPPDKVKLIRAALPDAAYCEQTGLLKALKSAQPLAAPIKPTDMMNRYGQRTTAQKLGIAAGSKVAALRPPRNLTQVLGEMPAGVGFVEKGGAVTLCFVHSPDDLRLDMSAVRGLAAETKLWFIWRKKSSPNHDGVTDCLVRDTGIALGLVDYKVCSINETWTAMLFAQKK